MGFKHAESSSQMLNSFEKTKTKKKQKCELTVSDVLSRLPFACSFLEKRSILGGGGGGGGGGKRGPRYTSVLSNIVIYATAF